MQRLGKVELEDILNGAAFFGSGGGGSRKMGQDLSDEILQHAETVDPIGVEEVSADTLSLVWNGTESDGH